MAVGQITAKRLTKDAYANCVLGARQGAKMHVRAFMFKNFPGVNPRTPIPRDKEGREGKSGD